MTVLRIQNTRANDTAAIVVRSNPQHLLRRPFFVESHDQKKHITTTPPRDNTGEVYASCTLRKVVPKNIKSKVAQRYLVTL